jgi:aminoglycoside phosphotransferase (APT) family kinase protein
VTEKTCNTAYEPLIHALASEHLRQPAIRLTPIPTYLDTIVYEIATTTHTFILKAIDPQSRDPDGIALEAWVCAKLAELGIPAPHVVALDTSCATFPSAYFIMEKARGQPLSTLALSRQEKQPYFVQLGAALRRMHAIQVPGFGWLDERAYRQHGEVSGGSSTWQQALCGPVPAGLTYLVERAGVSGAEAAAIEGVVEAMRDRLAQYHDGRLLHGDLGALHVWVDPATQKLTSIIDFGNRLSGDPLWDFVDYEWEDASALWTAYSPDSGDSPIFGPVFYSYALLRAIPWAHKLHARGAVHVVDWLRITLERASKPALGG